MIRVTVSQTALRVIEYTNKRTNQPAQLRIQTAYAHTVDDQGNRPPYPERFELVLQRDQQPYPPGDYQLHPASLYVDRDGKLQCSPRLAPIKATSPAQAA